MTPDHDGADQRGPRVGVRGGDGPADLGAVVCGALLGHLGGFGMGEHGAEHRQGLRRLVGE